MWYKKVLIYLSLPAFTTTAFSPAYFPFSSTPCLQLGFFACSRPSSHSQCCRLSLRFFNQSQVAQSSSPPLNSGHQSHSQCLITYKYYILLNSYGVKMPEKSIDQKSTASTEKNVSTGFFWKGMFISTVKPTSFSWKGMQIRTD